MSELIVYSAIFLPLFAGLLGFILPESWSRPRYFLGSILLELALMMGVLGSFNRLALDPIHLAPFSSQLFAADGLSLLMAMTAVAVYLIIGLLELGSTTPRSNWYYFWLLMIQSALMALFFSFNTIAFYVSWELCVIPGIFLFYGWGSGNTRQVGMRLLIVSFIGSLSFLAGLALLLLGQDLPWAMAGFLLAFILKTPLVPFHRWQPDIYVQSDANTSIVYAALLSKMGVFGVARLMFSYFPQLPLWVVGAVSMMGLLSLLYAASVAFAQTDYKRLIAYSSLSHMGLIFLAFYTRNIVGLQGGIFQIVVHAIGTAGLFALGEILRRRTGTLSLDSLGGIRALSPVLSGVFAVVILGTIGLPLTGGFIGEFLMLTGLIKFNFLLAILATLSLVLGAGYWLKAFARMMLGPVSVTPFGGFVFSRAESVLMGLLVIGTIGLGIFPQPILNLTEVFSATSIIVGFCPW